MYPIALVLAGGVAIAVERWFTISRALNTNRRAGRAVLPLVQQGNIKGVVQLAEKTRAPIARMVGAASELWARQRPRDIVESKMAEGLLETIPHYERRTQYLATLANVATLMGLLGTIIGLISAFTAVADANPAEKATLLSQSISVAMNTTAFGLITAIPLLMVHAMIQSKTRQLIDSLETTGVKCLNLMSSSEKEKS
jgi:biopolymer transport protein ExbB/TolQ